MRTVQSSSHANFNIEVGNEPQESMLRSKKLTGSNLSLLMHAQDEPIQVRSLELQEYLIWSGKAGVPPKLALHRSQDERRLFEQGRRNYRLACAVCHHLKGQGMQDRSPSLLGSPWVIGEPSILARIVLHGKQSEGSAMPSMANLDDETLASILTYIRQAWGHTATPVTSSLIANVRKETAERMTPFHEEELRQSANAVQNPGK